MPQIVCRIPRAFTPSVAAALCGVRALGQESMKGDAQFVGRCSGTGERIELRSDGTITYEVGDAPRAILIQAIKGILPPPPARYVLGFDEAGIGGESKRPTLAAVLLSTDIRAELIVEGVRDSKSVKSDGELTRLAKIIRENAIFEKLVDIPPTPAKGSFAKEIAARAARVIIDFLESGFTTDGLSIIIDQIDRDTFMAELGPQQTLVEPIIQIERHAEQHPEVAAASILARLTAARHPSVRTGKSPAPETVAPFLIGKSRLADKEQILTFLRRLELSYPDIAQWIDKGGNPGGIWDSVESGKYNCLVARNGPEVVGFSLSQMKDGRNTKMSTFYVAPSHRKRNVGSRLIREEISRLSSEEATRLMVTFGHEEFHAMQPFFTKFGFTVDGISPQRYRDNSFEVVMGKRFKYGSVGNIDFTSFIQNTQFRMMGYDISPLTADSFLATPRQALFAIHQLSPERQYLVKATTSPTPEAELGNLRKEAASRNALPVLASLYGFPAETPLPNDVLVFDAYEIENQFYPLHLERAEATDLLIPIQPRYADLLFPDPEQVTFGASSLALRGDKVYYRADKGARGLRRGARLFWYVSDPVKRIIGTAKLREVVRGSPAKLYGRFGGLGAWKQGDIEDSISGKSAMALVFEWFRRTPGGVSLTDLRSIRPNINLTTVVSLSHSEGDQILKAASLK